MNHKKSLSSRERMKIIGFLRKQRDGLIIGEYRSLLVTIYKKIAKIINQNNGVCTISDLFDLSETKTMHERNVVIDRCMDLEQLGYIRIQNDETIDIQQELDF